MTGTAELENATPDQSAATRGQDLVRQTAAIASAYLSKNRVRPEDVATLIRAIYDALHQALMPVAADPPVQEPAVPIRSSVKPDYLVCLEDGAKLKTLKRYLRVRHGMTPDEYRAKWGLPRDYPMVAPAYTAKRRELAMSFGLGRKPEAPDENVPAPNAAQASVSPEDGDSE